MRFDHVQPNFTAGELSPRLWGRIELEKYTAGLAYLHNMLVLPHGPVQRRGGTKFISAVKHHLLTTGLIPFVIAQDEKYMLEFGDQYIRLFANQASLNWSPVTDNDYNGPWIVNGGPLPGGEYPVGYLALNTDVDGHRGIYSCIQSAQSENVLHEPGVGGQWEECWTMKWHEQYPLWVDATAYVVDDTIINEANDLFYECIADHTAAAATNEPGVGTNWEDFWVLVGFAEIDTPYTADEIRQLRVTQDQRALYIVHPNHHPKMLTDEVTDEWELTDIPFTDPPAEWVAGNYPSVIWFFEQRLGFASTPNEPQNYWMSQPTEFFNFLVTGDADSALVGRIVSNEFNAIQWVMSGEYMTMGTYGAEWKLSSTNTNEALTQATANMREQTAYGSAPMNPIRIDSHILFMQQGARKLRRYKYQFESDAFVAEDLTLLSEHMTRSGFKKIVHHNAPDSVLWGLRNDGILAAMTYEPENGVYGWHRHSITGRQRDPFLTGRVQDVAVLPGPEGSNKDELWMIVERTGTSQVYQYIEVMTHGLLPEDADEDAFFVDSGITKEDTVEFDVVENLGHLEGERVQMLVDGAVQPPQVVVGGQVALTVPGKKAHVGLGFISFLETLPLEGGSDIGSAQFQIKRVSQVHIRFYRSLGCWIGAVNRGDPDIGNIERYSFGPTPKMDEAIPFLTDDITMPYPGGHDTQGRLRIFQEHPLPMTVLLIGAEARTK